MNVKEQARVAEVLTPSRRWTLANPEKVKEYRQRFIRRHPESRIYSNLNYRSEKHCLTRQEFVGWYHSVAKICKYCDIPEDLLWINTTQRGNHSFTIDRLDNKRGYYLGNLALSCFLCNRIKSDYFNASEMREIAQKYIKPKWKLPTSAE